VLGREQHGPVGRKDAMAKEMAPFYQFKLARPVPPTQIESHREKARLAPEGDGAATWRVDGKTVTPVGQRHDVAIASRRIEHDSLVLPASFAGRQILRRVALSR